MNRRAFGLIAGFFILAMVPLTVIISQRVQQIQQNAAVFSGSPDTCNLINFTATESPTCQRLTQSTDGNNTCTIPNASLKNSNITDYTYTVALTSNDGKQHVVKYHYLSSFCTHGYGDLRGSTKDCHCNDNSQSSGNISLTVDASGSKSIQMHRTPISGFSSCGAYQMDLSVDSIDGKTSCVLKANTLGNTLSVGHCDTGIDCTVPTPTPKPSNAPTPTVTPKLTITPTQPPILQQCEANKSICSWNADSNAVSYHYQVFNASSALLTEGDVQAPQTSVQFPSTAGQSYKCSVTGINACGIGQAGVGQFTCNITPTPSLCVTPPAPKNVKVSCPNCTQ